jgi:hypothetical protein
MAQARVSRRYPQVFADRPERQAARMLDSPFEYGPFMSRRWQMSSDAQCGKYSLRSLLLLVSLEAVLLALVRIRPVFWIPAYTINVIVVGGAIGQIVAHEKGAWVCGAMFAWCIAPITTVLCFIIMCRGTTSPSISLHALCLTLAPAAAIGTACGGLVGGFMARSVHRRWR